MKTFYLRPHLAWVKDWTYSCLAITFFLVFPNFSFSQTCTPYAISPNPVVVNLPDGSKTITFVNVILEENQGGGNCTSTWLYCINDGTGASISHLIFGLCDGVCFYDSEGNEIGGIIDAGTWTGLPSNPNLTTWTEDIQPGLDPTTNNFCGVKLDETADARNGFDNDPDGIIGFYFTIPGHFEVGVDFQIALKTGSGYAIATVPGPEFAESEEDCELCNSLPIELYDFSGKVEANQNQLFWTTLSESNSDYFTIERQSEETSWTAIGMLEANGDPFQRTDYSFIDFAPLQGHNYYRLRLVDGDGSYNYSAIVVLENNIIPGEGLIVYPVPAHESVNLMYLSEFSGAVDIQILNHLGQAVHTIQDHTLAKGTNRMTIDIESLTPGWYVVQIVGNGVSEVRGFVKN